VNDAALYDALRDEYRSSIATLLTSANASNHDPLGTIQQLRAEFYSVDGFDRAEVTASLDETILRAARLPTDGQRAERPTKDAGHSQDVVLRVLFDGAEPSDAPMFVILAGASGAGAGRAIAQLRHDIGGDIVPLSVDDLQAFHPRYLDPQFRQSLQGQQELSQLAASWLQASISHARENGYSLLLEGEFRTPDTALGVALRFADSGYDVHVVTVAAREDQSLLASTSRGLRRMQERQAAEFVTPLEHEQSMRDVSALIVAAADSPLVRRVSVLNQNGVSVFDAERSESGMLSGASVALSTSRSAATSALDATQWLSELRHMTEYARSLRTVPTPALDSLVALHEMALRRVVPELPVPPGSEVVRIQQQKLAADLAALERMQAHPEVVDVAAPVFTPAESDRPISR